MTDIDLKYMHRALELARMAGGNTRPNPMVGAVIVHKGLIIGEGYHAEAGKDHAELVALNMVADRTLIKNSDLYVTLEPCSHWGRTPPCAEMVARESFSRVIIGTLDTSPKVSGKGIKIIQSGGCKVETGVLEKECRDINRRFFTHHEKGRPYIILKWAQSADGYIDKLRMPDDKIAPNWITGDEERVLVHKWRSEEHSVLVGEKTLRNDDPSLDVRLWSGRNPYRLLLSSSRDLEGSFKLLSDGKPTLVFTPYPCINKKGVEFIEISKGKNGIRDLLTELHRREIQSVLVEGGCNVLNQFIEENLWDEARIFTGKVEFGSGLTAPQINGSIIETEQFKDSLLRIFMPV